MPIARYSKNTAGETIDRTMRVQFPGESLVALAECRSDRLPPVRESPSPPARSNPRFSYEPHDPGEDGYVGVTQIRLVLLERITHASVVRAMGYLIGVLALATAIWGDALVVFLILGGLAAAMIAGSRAVEAVRIGATSIPFDRVLAIDAMDQRIEGLGVGGRVCRITIADPVQFHAIACQVPGWGAASAA